MRKSQPNKIDDPREELVELIWSMNKAKNPDPEDVERLRQLALAVPAILSTEFSMTRSLRRNLIEKISQGVPRALMLAEVDLLTKQLDYTAAPPLERMLIDHILTLRVRLIHAESEYNLRVVNQSITYKFGEYWDNLLSSTQARFLRAIEVLTRVRRLARNTPALQINIANQGGQQVNVQGDVSTKNVRSSADGEPSGASPTVRG